MKPNNVFNFFFFKFWPFVVRRKKTTVFHLFCLPLNHSSVCVLFFLFQNGPISSWRRGRRTCAPVDVVIHQHSTQDALLLGSINPQILHCGNKHKLKTITESWTRKSHPQQACSDTEMKSSFNNKPKPNVPLNGPGLMTTLCLKYVYDVFIPDKAFFFSPLFSPTVCFRALLKSFSCQVHLGINIIEAMDCASVTEH